MNEPIYLYFGGTVAAFGVAFIIGHVTQKRKRNSDDTLCTHDSRFFSQQYRRRMQTSALTVMLGALIALCGHLTPFQTSPLFATCYVIGLLLLSLWLVLLALSDAMASRVFASQVLRRDRKAQQSLQEALTEARRNLESASGVRDAENC